MTTQAQMRDRRRERYYLTRDRDPDGTLSDTIDVWLTRPIRHRVTSDGGYVWVSSDERTWRVMNHGGPHWRRMTVDECRTKFATAPDVSAECLYVPEVGP